MSKLIWEYNNSVIADPLELGTLEHLAESAEFDVAVSHDSTLEISDCSFYISPFTEDYEGSFSALKDFERVLWLGNNYPGYGLSLRQVYEVTGTVDGHDGIRLVDFNRAEKNDIFSGNSIEILTGPAVGESVLISNYDPLTQVMTLASDFSADVKGSDYKISIDNEDFFKVGSGADYSSAIPLIYKGGVIERFDSATIKLKLRIPKFAQSAGNFLFDLNMQFTSLE